MILTVRMGKLFLTWLIFLLFPAATQAKSKIQLMPPPLVISPPEEDKNALDEDLINMKSQRKEREGERPGRIRQEVIRQRQKLSELAKEDVDYRVGFQISLIWPHVLTRGIRKNFTTELSSHFTGFFLTESHYQVSRLQLWTGLRIASFAGSAQVGETIGRYGFLYFGPMIGLGKIGPAEISSPRTEKRRAVEKKSESYPVRTGWMLITGLSAQSRQGATDPTDDFTSQDLDTTRAVKFDKPGLWAEFIWLNLHYGRLGLHYLAGAQLGDGKTFIWAGVGMGGWS